MSTAVDQALRFDTFVVGASNRLAVSAARAVAEAPGQAYNPLFVYGESGRGKTHLVAAIAHRAQEMQPATRVLFSSGEEVAEHLHRSIASGQPEQFLEHYRQAGLLILDDVQFLTGQRETQSELLRLLNALMRGGQQLVFTSDRQPADIPDVDQRLLSRLSGGLVVDVGARISRCVSPFCAMWRPNGRSSSHRGCSTKSRVWRLRMCVSSKAR